MRSGEGMIDSPLRRPRNRKYPYLSVDQLNSHTHAQQKLVRSTFTAQEISKGMLPCTAGPKKQLRSPKNLQKNQTSKDGRIWSTGKGSAGLVIGHQSTPQTLIKPNLLKMMHSLDEMIHQEGVTVALPSKALPLTHKKKLMKSRYHQARFKIELSRSYEQSPQKEEEEVDPRQLHQRRSLFMQLVTKSDKLKQIYASEKRKPKVSPSPKVEPWIRYITQPLKLIRNRQARRRDRIANQIFNLSLGNKGLSPQKSNSLDIRRYLNDSIIEQRMKATCKNHRMHLQRRQTMAHKTSFITQESIEEERVGKSRTGVTPWHTEEYCDGYM